MVLGVIALVCFKLGRSPPWSSSTVVVTLAAAEAYAAFRQAGYHPATLLGLVATVSLMVATYNKGQAALPLVLVLLVAFTLLWYLAGVDRAAAGRAASAPPCSSSAGSACSAPSPPCCSTPTLFPDRHGIAFLLGAIIAAVAYDVGALAVGAWLGRHPLAPTVSPNKTWEGLRRRGRGLRRWSAVVVVHFIHPWTLGTASALGLVVAVVAPDRRPLRVAGQAGPRA